jgi:pyridoxine kinase
MKNPVKRVAAIHDLSGFGRASLTAIIPILSSMGIQVCPFPTAVLSSNTGGFKEFSFVGLTDSMEDYMSHWKKVDMEFDCIYSGFLGSAKQVDIILDFIENFKNSSNIMVVDPVLGDNGKLYPTIDKTIVEKMKDLVKRADIITPNLTEATYLLGRTYTKAIDEDEIKEILVELSNMGPKIVVITSVPDFDIKENIDVFAYEKGNNRFWKVGCKYIPVEFPGTGDTFTSVLIGSLLNGDSLPIALDRSVQFIQNGIRESYGFVYPRREGILLEKVLDTLKMPVMNSNYELLK